MKILLGFFAILIVIPGLASPPKPPVLNVPLEVNLPVLDFTEAEDFVTIRVLLNLGRGLVGLDENLKPVPGLARAWNVSKDGRVYAFELEKNFWSNGRAISSEDFVRGFEHTFSPSTAAKIAVPLLDVIEGARAYKAGRLRDFRRVGVKAEGPHTVKITLVRPAPYFLSLLALPVAFPEPAEAADYKVEAGTPTSGSYFLDKKDGRGLTLKPNAFSNAPAANELRFLFVPESTTAVALYEKGNLDVVFRIPGSDFARFVSSPELKTAPWLSTYYLGFNLTKPPFNDKRLREAVIEAVDRKALNQIFKDKQRPSSSWVPAPLEGSQDAFGPKYDPAGAERLWNSVKGSPRHLELVLDAQEKNTLIGSFIQEQLESHLGVKVTLRSMEWKSYLNFLSHEKPPFFRFGWLAAFPDPLSHLGVFTSNNPNNNTGFADPGYDRLVDRIAALPAGPKRTKLIVKAQKLLLTEKAAIFPLFNYVQYTLIRRKWQGLDLTPMGLLDFHRARPTSLF